MKYKFQYTDSQNTQHIRYYTALNASTAAEMFDATVNHSIQDKVSIEFVECLDGSSWKRLRISPVGCPLDNIPTSQV